MRRIYSLWATLLLLLLVASPVLAAEGGSLENSVLIPGWVGAALAVLALVLFFLVDLRARRGP